MELEQALEGRRSIREYDGRAVPRESIEAMIRAASLAPSWKNSQTGRYYVIENKEMIDTYRETCFQEYNAGNTKDAGALIVTTFVSKRAGFYREGNPVNELGEGWGCYDLGLQNQNLLLKAHELGLGTLVMGIRDEPKTRELLNIPSDQIIVSVIAVGYPNIEPEMPSRKEVEAITKFF